jgi:4'-phosphopantetheinyl transferase
MALVLYTTLSKPFSPARFRRLMGRMPGRIQKGIMRYRRWQDAHACLAGKLLLLEGLESFGYPAALINELQYTDHNKPFFAEGPHFNISHTDGLIACALSPHGPVGIDVERLQPVPLQDFKNIWSAGEWKSIQEAEDIYQRFFTLWTMKEAIIKAEGQGLSIPLPHVRIINNRCVINDTTWALQPLELHEGFISHLATANEMPAVQTRQLYFNKKNANSKHQLPGLLHPGAEHIRG